MAGRSWLTPLFSLVLVAIGIGGWLVFQRAQDAVLESQSGSIRSVPIDPNAPGFRAYTEPTPTGLVLHTAVTRDGRPDLVGVTFMAAADGDRGGTVITVPSMFIPSDADGGSLADLFSDVGFFPVLDALKATFGVGFTEVVVLDADSWTALMATDTPLELSVRQDLVDSDSRVVLASGTRPYDLDEIAVIASHGNPDEPALALARRQQSIWRAWISRTAAASDRPALFGVDEGFVKLIGDLAGGEVAYRTIPMTTAPGTTGGATRYLADENAIDEVVAQLVPFPISATPGERPSVMLLDGTGGAVDQASFLSAVVRGGGQVAIVGNTEASDVASSEIRLHDPEAASEAAAIAAELGIDAPTDAPLTEATVSITIVVGADLASAS